jgi:hypothetical protein
MKDTCSDLAEMGRAGVLSQATGSGIRPPLLYGEANRRLDQYEESYYYGTYRKPLSLHGTFAPIHFSRGWPNCPKDVDKNG